MFANYKNRTKNKTSPLQTFKLFLSKLLSASKKTKQQKRSTLLILQSGTEGKSTKQLSKHTAGRQESQQVEHVRLMMLMGLKLYSVDTAQPLLGLSGGDCGRAENDGKKIQYCNSTVMDILLQALFSTC